MKLDKITFARIIGYIERVYALNLDQNDIEKLDNLIDIEVPVAEKLYISSEIVDELLRQMALGNKISAIKAYRTLTGLGVKESKDAVEKYWVRQLAEPIPVDASLGDILAQAERK